VSYLGNLNFIKVGSHKDCDIVIDNELFNSVHFTITQKSEDIYYIEPHSTAMNIKLNERRLFDKTRIIKGDIIIVENFRFGFKSPINKNKTLLSAQNIEKAFPNGFMGIHKSSFEINAGEIIGVMGPSGCGKSTLLKCLNGYSKTTGGNIFLAGLDLNLNFDYLKSKMGYVPQDDIIHNELTVEQSLYYSAKLKLPNSTKSEQRERINEVLLTLKINDVRDNLVSKISGGQRKRVCIAAEILNDPLILFLDEPTSPLDPQSIEDFMRVLESLADKGTSVIMVTHKPEDLNYLDKVMFLSKGGHITYFETPKEILSHFKSERVVQVYEMLDNARKQEWIDVYVNQVKKSKPQNQGTINLINELSVPVKTNYFYQYFILTLRAAQRKLNDWSGFLMLIGQAPIIAILMSLIYDELNSTVPFFMATTAIWLGTNNAAREIVSEQSIFKRERMFSQGIIPYIFSKITILSFIALVQAILFIAIIDMNFKSSTVHFQNTFSAFGWMFFVTVCASIMGLLISSIVNTTEKVMTIVPLVLIPQIMLAGVVVKINNIFVELISYLTLSRWSFQGFSIIQKEVSTPKYIAQVNNINSETFIVKSIDNQIVSSKMEMADNFHESFSLTFGEAFDTVEICVVFLSGIALLFFILTYLALKEKDEMQMK
jgi:ABC-type multidrug transport system ATPase subunit/ABC-type multidrug transport system permease subunit